MLQLLLTWSTPAGAFRKKGPKHTQGCRLLAKLAARGQPCTAAQLSTDLAPPWPGPFMVTIFKQTLEQAYTYCTLSSITAGHKMTVLARQPNGQAWACCACQHAAAVRPRAQLSAPEALKVLSLGALPLSGAQSQHAHCTLSVYGH